ncbi:MAG: aldolase catalytic domain-containing protein [Candidatus Omnitrophota bacterium]|jgi:4-hydroxy 2-oxovalerate aldolase
MKKTGNKKLEILDCTVRDGGYLNDWAFSKKMVKEICRSLSKTGVDIVELGFRNQPSGKDESIWRSVSEDLVNEMMSGVSGISAALMIDIGKGDFESIPEAGTSRVKMYRVACHKDKIKEAMRLCEDIKAKGYKTSLQLMGISSLSEKELSDIIKPLTESSLDYVYIADSYGSLFPQDIKRYVEVLKLTGKRIGFHAHNSLQLAFANSLEAVNCGADIIDGTIYGMGRGAGNLPLEVMVAYIEKTLGHKRYNSIPILDLIDRYFVALKQDLGWGYSLPYMLSGILEVHPNYAKHLADYHEYSVDDMMKALEVVKGLNPVGFDKGVIDKIMESGFVSGVEKSASIDHDPKELKMLLKDRPAAYQDRHKDRDFLILGNGPSLKACEQDIKSFIDKYDPIVMGANYLGGLFVPDYHAFSNKKRFINYVDAVSKDSKLLLSTSFDDDFIKEHTSRPFEWLAHLSNASTDFDIKKGIITSNCRTVSILMAGVAIVMGARRIFIAGMDGYKQKDAFLSRDLHFYKESEDADNFKLLMEKHNMNETMLKNINHYLTERHKEGLHIITPTSHNYFYSGIQNWILAYDKI